MKTKQVKRVKVILFNELIRLMMVGSVMATLIYLAFQSWSYFEKLIVC